MCGCDIGGGEVGDWWYCVVWMYCAEDAQAHATACQKLFPQNCLLDSLYQNRKHSARRAVIDTCTVFVITVTRGTGKYDDRAAVVGQTPLAISAEIV